VKVASLDNLLFILLIAVAALFQLLSKAVTKARKRESNETPTRPAPKVPRPNQRAPAESDADRIRKFVEADSVSYLSLEALRESVADRDHNFCYACYTGDYPTDLVQLEVREGGSNGQLLKDPGIEDSTPVQTDRPVTVTHES